MQTTKVAEWVDIDAPSQEVFELILNLKRRLQLSPLWGTTKIEEISPQFPHVGSHYRISVPEAEEPVAYETRVIAMTPGRKFSYSLSVDRQTEVTWLVQKTALGTRVLYEETFHLKDGEGEEFVQSVHNIVRQWLRNMKRYAELRESRGKRLARWLVDRYYLNLRPDQRKTVQAILFMQIVGTISFVMAALAVGLANLF